MDNQHKLSPTIKLYDGGEMPLVGLGTFLSKNENIMKDLLQNAFDIGYRHIDTAILYGNHKFIGSALKQIFAEGKYKRSDIFITSKVYPVKGSNAMELIKQSLVDLQTDYLDLFLVHWPLNEIGTGEGNDFFQMAYKTKPVHVMWKEMEEIKKAGLAKSIGVSNYNVQSLINLLSFAEIKPSVNQIELSPYLMQPRLVEFCQKWGIVVTAYSTLVRGGSDVTLLLGNKIDMFHEPTLVEIAKKHNRTVAQVVLNYMIGKKIVVIPKTENVNRLKENFFCFDFQLQKEEIEQIEKLDKGLRTIDPYVIPSWHGVPVFS